MQRTSHHFPLATSLADWLIVVAAIGLVLGIAITTIRVAPAQSVERAPSLQAAPPHSDKPTATLPYTGESLSDRLERGNGVIAPPSEVDDDMAVPPREPNAGASMPVIRPPDGPTASQ